MDFWKGLVCVELLIYVGYVVYGMFGYAWQGTNIWLARFTSAYLHVPGKPLATLSSLSPASLPAACRATSGIKAFNNVGRDIFRFPVIESSKGISFGSSSSHCTGLWRWSSRYRFHRLRTSSPLSKPPASFNSRTPFLLS